MNASLDMLMRYFRTCRVVNTTGVFTLEVRRENSMDSAAVNVPRIPMTMICLGMHVEEWKHEHPQGRPHEDQHSKIRWFVAYPFH
jgi:hypothetical protein